MSNMKPPRSFVNDFGVTAGASVKTSRRRKVRLGRFGLGCICDNCRGAYSRNQANRKERHDAKAALRLIF